MRTVLICGGGDWADASADLLDIPDTVTIPLEQLYQGYQIWWRQARVERTPDKTFPEWLKSEFGAQDSACEQIHDT